MDFSQLRLEKIVSVIEFCPRNKFWTAKNRSYHIIGVALSGMTHHDFGYKNIDICENTLYFFNQRDDFTASVETAGFCYSVHFTTAEPISTNSFSKKISNPNHLKDLILKIGRSVKKGNSNNLETLSLFYAFCDELWKLGQSQTSFREKKLLESREYIDLNFKEKDCLGKAADLFPATRRRFNDVFKESFDLTPNKYLTKKRLDYSKELLETGIFNVSQISEMCGFSDLYYFSKVFKSNMGISPSEYKSTSISQEQK